MFELEYCNDPENGDIKNSGITFEDDIAKLYENACETLENYIYLIDMFKIIESCSEDLISANTMDIDYWKVNKVLLNYVNSIYSFKELADGFVPEISVITEKYYRQEKWYRFVCDFRNSVIHESVISQDYNKDDAYVLLDKLIDIQQKRRVNTPSKEQNRIRQITFLEAMKKDALEHSGKYYYGIKRMCRDVSAEMQELKLEVLMYAYDNSICPILSWLFDIMYKEDSEYRYVFIVDKSIGAESVCEPNFLIEDFYLKMKHSLGEENEVFCKIRSLFEDMEYNHFFG